ncbi:MAG: hypothetical protein FWF88_11985, partial [Peptococcaceae bacterium]|nr:hypothetical protein [Peptococcaceae bacterium]
KNSNRLFQFLGDCLAVQMQVWADWRAAYLNWYHCGGGKEIIKIVGAVLVVIAAIAILVMSFPVSGIFALIAVIGAAMFVIDSLFKLYHSGKALEEYNKGDPAWAQVYGRREGMSDFLTKTNFNNAAYNRASMTIAKVWTGGQRICGVVGCVRFVGNLKPLSNLLSTRAGVGSHLVSSRTFIAGGKDGIKIKNTFTSQSVWNGFKTIAGDKGVRSTLASNFVKDFKVFKPTSINPLQYMKQISNISKPGLALFGDAKTTSQSIAGIAKGSISTIKKVIAPDQKIDITVLSGT